MRFPVTSAAMVMTGSRVWTMKDGTSHPTGFWAEEFVKPHRTFTMAGLDVTLATPQGRTPAVDPLSYNLAYNEDDQDVVDAYKEYLGRLREQLEHAVPLAALDPRSYDVVFVVGGHGPMQDLAVEPSISDLLNAVLDDPGKILAAVCHGPASFLSAHRPDGSWLFKGRTLTGFSNEEETQAGFAGNAPWLLQDRLTLSGARYVAEPAWTPHAVTDGNLVTGQQNYSAQATADAVLKVLRG
jgi:putative intracellular protease/amidase